MRVALWYFATRLVGLLPFVWPEAVLLREPTHWLVDLDKLGPLRALPEYPWPTALLAYLPMYLGIPSIVHYYATVVIFVLAADALMTWSLWRAGGRAMRPGLWAWLLFFPALGPLIVTRLDIVPAVLSAGALIALSAAWRGTAGGLAALGAGFKLWPVLVLPALLVPGERADRMRVIAGFAVCGTAVVLLGVVVAGTERLWSPIAMQGERGLQIEAFAALPFLWARYYAADRPWAVAMNMMCNCHEVSGPGVRAALALSQLAMIGAVAALVALGVRALRAPSAARTASLAALCVALGVLALLLTSRVFSPQYMIWLAAPLAAYGVLPEGKLAPAEVAFFSLACLLTHLVFPVGYEALLTDRHFLQGTALVVLTARDALVVLLALSLTRRLWRVIE